MTAYLVPAVTVSGEAKVTVLSPPAPPSLNPARVVEARSAPVGTGVTPVVARMETVMFGFAPEQPEQKSSMSARVSWPLMAGVKVWPAQLVLVKVKPVGLTVELF